MSSAGMRGMISNNAGAPHYFQKRDSGDATSANDAAAAGRRRVSAAKKELYLLSTSFDIFFRPV